MVSAPGNQYQRPRLGSTGTTEHIIAGTGVHEFRCHEMVLSSNSTDTDTDKDTVITTKYNMSVNPIQYVCQPNIICLSTQYNMSSWHVPLKHKTLMPLCSPLITTELFIKSVTVNPTQYVCQPNTICLST